MATYKHNEMNRSILDIPSQYLFRKNKKCVERDEYGVNGKNKFNHHSEFCHKKKCQYYRLNKDQKKTSYEKIPEKITNSECGSNSSRKQPIKVRT